jgi:hypothetical protein
LRQRLRGAASGGRVLIGEHLESGRLHITRPLQRRSILQHAAGARLIPRDRRRCLHQQVAAVRRIYADEVRQQSRA